MKSMMKAMLVFLVILGTLVLLTGCGGEDERDAAVSNLLAEFEYACNTRDIEAALNCLDPVRADGIRLTGGFLSTIFGRDINDMFGDLFELFSVETGADISEFLGSMHIEITGISGLGEKTAVSAVVTYEVVGQKIVRETVFYCKYYVDRWYIEDFKIQ